MIKRDMIYKKATGHLFITVYFNGKIFSVQCAILKPLEKRTNVCMCIGMLLCGMYVYAE